VRLHLRFHPHPPAITQADGTLRIRDRSSHYSAQGGLLHDQDRSCRGGNRCGADDLQVDPERAAAGVPMRVAHCKTAPPTAALQRRARCRLGRHFSATYSSRLEADPLLTDLRRDLPYRSGRPLMIARAFTCEGLAAGRPRSYARPPPSRTAFLIWVRCFPPNDLAVFARFGIP
jgi:hypothetical protein